ncbi:MAG: VIT domain-containing protein [Betaproteobacteria bacterium]|nr:VIT domain-containing protein [Betaproteobacteria bacterium]
MPSPTLVRIRHAAALAVLLLPLHAPGQNATVQRIAPPPLRPPLLRIASPAERPVTLQSLRVDTEIAGSLAQTEIEMTFLNPNRRILEGELQFPLLDGQRIAGFAMDIDGTLRDAVPVDKARGQAVFEDVTRQRVDPALLQATQGNNFKLRVYPLLPGKTKTIVLRIAETVGSDAGRRIHRLALDYATASRVFTLRIKVHGAAAAPRGSARALGEVLFRRAGDAWLAELERRNFSASGVLELELPASVGEMVHTEERGGRTYFHAEVPIQTLLAPRAAPGKVALVWDSSGSGAAREHAREFALLDAYFHWMKNGEVRLTRLRDIAEPEQVFRIADGDWSALRRALEATEYDGATALGAYADAHDADEWLVFTDGLGNFGEGRFDAHGKRVYAVSAALRADHATLRGIVAAGGGRTIDLLRESGTQAARKLTHDSTRLLDIQALGAAQVVTDSRFPTNGRITLAGELLERDARLQLDFGVPGQHARRIELRLRAAARSGRLAAARWAALRIAELETDYELHRAEIARIGKSFGLVTRETSLIVLDRVEDYLRYEIVPPTPLLARFEQLRVSVMQRRDADRHNHLERIVKLFEEKQRWWNREFPREARPAAIAPRPEAQVAQQGMLQERLGAQEMRQRDAASVQRESRSMAAPAAAAERAAGAASAGYSARANLTKNDGSASADGVARIRLKPWTPDAPYARRMREASADKAYRVYLDEKPDYANSTAFYLDAADLLFEKGLDDLAIRVLGNLAEMDLENRHVLRVLGYRLVQARRPALAIPVFRKVLELSPEEPQSYRDLGLAYAADKQFQKALDSLYEVVTRPWHGRFPEVELIALAELNAIAGTPAAKVDTRRFDPRLIRNLPLDLRAVLTWDADNTDIDLWVTDPNGEKAFYGHRLTWHGGRMSQDFTGGYGPEEFSLRKALPGRYKIEAQFYGHRQQIVAGATTLQVTVQTHFGTDAAKEELITLRLKGRGEVVYVGEIVID